MKDSTRRALRTGYQTLIAAIPVLAILGLFLNDLVPGDHPWAGWLAAAGGALVAASAAVSKLINSLEAGGHIPAWLKAPPGRHAAVDPGE